MYAAKRDPENSSRRCRLDFEVLTFLCEKKCFTWQR